MKMAINQKLIELIWFAWSSKQSDRGAWFPKSKSSRILLKKKDPSHSWKVLGFSAQREETLVIIIIIIIIISFFLFFYLGCLFFWFLLLLVVMVMKVMRRLVDDDKRSGSGEGVMMMVVKSEREGQGQGGGHDDCCWVKPLKGWRKIQSIACHLSERER